MQASGSYVTNTTSLVFRGKFAAVFREYTPKHFRKTFYVHMTNVTETKDMRGILSSGANPSSILPPRNDFVSDRRL